MVITSISTRGNYLIIQFFRSGYDPNCGIDVHYSPRNSSRLEDLVKSGERKCLENEVF